MLFGQSKKLIEWRKRDYLIFYVLIPAILLLLYFVPQNFKESYLILNTADPSIISIFLSNYTHTQFKHFISNSAMYLLLMFLLFNLETNSRLFYKVSALILIFLPILSSLIVIIKIPNMGNVQGFSAVTSALAGYLIYAVYGYLKNVRRLKVNSSFVNLVVLLNLTIVSFLPLPVPTLIRLIFLTLSVWYTYRNRVIIRQIISTILKLVKESVYEYWVFFFALFFMFSLPSLIPKNIV
jgi:hypothetical protein